jgi:CarD family transcriptional regulator
MSKISTKSILKKIFKGKSDKEMTKKVKKKKVTKVKKVVKTKTKKVKKVVVKKAKKVLKKIPNKSPKIKKVSKTTETPDEPKVDNLRISKTNEVKPEIKKVKKQETEKREFKIKDYVVYPKHGVGQITEFKKINIGGIDVETYVIKFEKDKANGMVPVNKQSHLRPLATINQVNKCISILKSKPKIKRSMWSRRAQEYEAKISSGKIYELAEVVRDLNKGDDLMVDQSYSERQLFEKAYERMQSEFQIILNLSPEDTQKKLDKALKRNVGGQTQAISATPKTPTADLPVEEPISETDEPLDEEKKTPLTQKVMRSVFCKEY